jgi:hypothetical protein
VIHRENLIYNDELKIYRGNDFIVTKDISIHQPTLDEICEYGESNYWKLIYGLTSVGADMKWQLWDKGVDYTKISDFELFYGMICKMFNQKQTSIVFGDIDLRKFKLFQKTKNDVTEIFLFDEKNKIVINDYIYTIMISIIRQIHGLKRNSKLPANESTKRILIEDDRNDYLKNKNKETHSILKNLISTMINCTEFKYNYSEVWNMKIGAFIDSVKRVKKIKYANLLLQSGYSGFGIKLEDIDKKQLDWCGELD